MCMDVHTAHMYSVYVYTHHVCALLYLQPQNPKTPRCQAMREKPNLLYIETTNQRGGEIFVTKQVQVLSTTKVKLAKLSYLELFQVLTSLNIDFFCL